MTAELGAGLGKGPSKFKLVWKELPKGLSKRAVRRLARRGGVKRISNLIHQETQKILRSFLTMLIKDAVIYTSHSGRKTVTALDVILSLNRQGHTLYGFDAS